MSAVEGYKIVFAIEEIKANHCLFKIYRTVCLILNLNSSCNKVIFLKYTVIQVYVNIVNLVL